MKYKHARFMGNIVPLISLALASFFLLILFVVVSYDDYLTKLDQVVETGHLSSRKMQLSSELMELARTRTLLTSQIINTEDVFRQDELNVELEMYAGRYVGKRQQLASLLLTHEEKLLLKKHLEIVSVILPNQRRAVELAMGDDEDDLELAKKLLYEVVLPGQSELIAILTKLVTLSREHTTALSDASRASVQSLKQRSSWIVIPVLFFISFVSIVVILKIRRIQLDLLQTRDNLEQTVTERTVELRNAQDVLQSVLDTIPVSVYWMDTTATYTGANARFAKDAGFGSVKDVIGKTDYDMPWSDYAEQYRREDFDVVESCEAKLDYVEKHKTADAKTFWLERSKVPLLNEKGNECCQEPVPGQHEP